MNASRWFYYKNVYGIFISCLSFVVFIEIRRRLWRVDWQGSRSAFPISWFVVLPASLADELRKTTKNLKLRLPVTKTDMQTGVFLATAQPHNSTASPGDDTGRYFAWLIYRVWWSRLFQCDDETEYRISLTIRSAAFLWASLRSGSRRIMFPDHLTGRYVLPYPSNPLQNGTMRHQDYKTDNTASWLTVGYVIISSLVHPLWCYKLRCSAPPKQQLNSAYCTGTCQLTIRYVAEGLAQVECCANRNWVYIQSAVYADTGELRWNPNSNALETNRPQHV